MSSKRERSRSRSRSKNKKKTRDRSQDKNEKRNRWSDAPSRFSNAPGNNDYDKGYSNNLLNYPTKPTASYGSSSAVNPNILYTLNDNTKIKRKIFIPKVSGVNFVGLLIGPRGTYQKRLELQSGCKILIRGKGTQKDGSPPQPDDNEEQHVLIVGETEENVNKAQYLVEKVLFADDFTRNRIKEEQLKASQEMRTELFLLPGLTDSQGRPIPQEIDDSLMTPYGPPDRNARILPVPNDCVGLIIGKNGETIRRLHRETACKIQIAKKEIPNTDVRNVFIEGPPEKYELAKKLIEEIIAEQQFLKQNFSHLGDVNPFPGPHTPLRIPNKMVGLIIGKNGETIRNIHQKTGCFIFIPKDSRPGEDYRELELSGHTESVELCKREIISMIHLALYGRLPYMNSLFYPFIDPVTGLPIIDPGIMSQLDPNSQDRKKNIDNEIQNYEMFQKQIFEFTKQGDTSGYNTDDYNNPLNYDLYYQSLYQMYPQMSDYYKKAMENKNMPPGEKKNSQTPYVIFNTGILDPNQQENNSLYDPNFISSYYNNSQNQIQQQINNQELKNAEQMNYLDSFHNYYDYENNKFLEENGQQEKKNEGDEIFDPFNIRVEMKGEEKINEVKPIQPKQMDIKQEQIDPKIYQDIDYDKYISKMFSNFQPQSSKKPVRGKNNNTPGQVGYDKDEINMSVNQYYATIYSEIDKKGAEKKNDNIDDKVKYEESKFEEPISKNRKRKSRFEDKPEK